MSNPEKDGRLGKKEVWVPPRIGSAEPSPLARIEEEAGAVRGVEELQSYRVVLRCRTAPRED